MVRPKDPFWKHAHSLKNGRFSCNFCHCEFSGGISRIKWHLSGHKSHDIKVCEQVPQDIRLAVRQVLDTPKRKDRQIEYEKVLDTPKRKDRQIEYENCSVPSSSSGRNLCMDNDNILKGQKNNKNLLELNHCPNSANEKDKCQLLDKQLAKCFFSFGINPKAIVSPIFKNFVKSIGEYGPSYQLPSPDTLEKELMQDVKKEAMGHVINFRNDQVQGSCTLTVNILNGEIFAYSQNGLACLKSFNYELETHCIPEVISSTIKLFGPNRVVQLLIADECCKWLDVSHEIQNHLPRISVSFCAAEVIDYFLIRMERELQSTIKVVKLIFYTYYHYKVSSRRGMKIPEEHSAFILLMLKSILNIEDELQGVSFSSIIESSEEVKLLDDEQEKAAHFIHAKLLDYIIGQKEFWSRVKLVAHVWVLLYQTRCLVNLEDSSIGYLYQMIERLKDGFEKSREQDHFIFDCSWKSFTEMRKKIIHPIHAAAAFLDPAYMYTDNFEINAEMKVGIDYMFENMIDSDEKEAFTKELQKYLMKLPELFTAQAVTMLKTWHPRIWWDFCGKHTVPVLSKYAIRILSQPCSTLFCRRFDVLRGADKLREDWTSKVNTMIINENFKSLKLEPIILDKLGEDLGAFNDRTEQYFVRYISCLSQLTNDALVNCVIKDSGPFWDNIEKNTQFLDIDL